MSRKGRGGKGAPKARPADRMPDASGRPRSRGLPKTIYSGRQEPGRRGGPGGEAPEDRSRWSLKEEDRNALLEELKAFWRARTNGRGSSWEDRLREAREHWRGDFAADEFGYDQESIEFFRPLLQFLFHVWWRVRITGLENVPDRGRCLLVCNHSGVLPWDGAMLNVAIWERHPRPRPVRALMLDLVPSLPFLSTLFVKTGQVPANPENAVKLLERDQLVATFPEGVKGLGKPYGQRYKLARFGRGGFVRVALEARAPIIPVSIVGAEEIYPMLANVKPLADLLGFPYFPITPTFPGLGPLGAVPLPSRWHIHFGEPMNVQEQHGPEDAEDFVVVSQLMDRVRDTIQAGLDRMVAERLNPFV